MNDPDDSALRAQFRATFLADEDDAPPFDRVWTSATTRHRWHRFRVLVAPLTAIAALLVVGAFLFTHPSPPPQKVVATALPWRSAILLSEWRAPSDALLSVPDPAPLSFELHH